MSATLLSSLLARLEEEDFDEEQWRLLFRCSLRIQQSRNQCTWGDDLGLDERLALQKALLRSPMIDTDLLEKSQQVADFDSFPELGHNPMAVLWLESSPDGSGTKMLFKAMRLAYSYMAYRIGEIHYKLYFDNLLLLLQKSPWKKAFQNEPYLENCFARINQGIAPSQGNAQIMLIKISENMMRNVRQQDKKAMMLHQWFHALENALKLEHRLPKTPLCFLDQEEP